MPTYLYIILFLAWLAWFSAYRPSVNTVGVFIGGGPAPAQFVGPRGSGVGIGIAGRGNRVPITGRASPGLRFGSYGNRFGYGSAYAWPYYPVGGYNSVLPLGHHENLTDDYGPSTNSIGAVYAVSDHAGTILAPSVASPVLHEYHFSEQPRSLARGKVTFTIVLKDGSSRSAVASWVAGGKLHYLDSRAQQYVLTPEMIDRDPTEKANEANNLRLELPPG